MPDFNMGGYPPTLIFIKYQAFQITKHNKYFFKNTSR
jgi:hypothetical protein